MKMYELIAELIFLRNQQPADTQGIPPIWQKLVRSQSRTSRSAVQQEIICCSNRIKMVQKARKIKVFRAFTISKRSDIV